MSSESDDRAPGRPGSMAAYFGFDSVSVTGRVDLTIRVGPKLDYSLTHPDEEIAPELFIRRQDGTVAITAPDDLKEPFKVDITSPGLSGLHASGRATVRIWGAADTLRLSAYWRAIVDASELTLASAHVSLETFSNVTVAPTDSITGSVGYGAYLNLLSEPPNASVATGNAGRINP